MGKIVPLSQASEPGLKGCGGWTSPEGLLILLKLNGLKWLAKHVSRVRGGTGLAI